MDNIYRAEGFIKIEELEENGVHSLGAHLVFKYADHKNLVFVFAQFLSISTSKGMCLRKLPAGQQTYHVQFCDQEYLPYKTSFTIVMNQVMTGLLGPKTIL